MYKIKIENKRAQDLVGKPPSLVTGWSVVIGHLIDLISNINLKHSYAVKLKSYVVMNKIKAPKEGTTGLIREIISIVNITRDLSGFDIYNRVLLIRIQ